MKLDRVLGAATLALLAACSGDSNGPTAVTVTDSGTASFAYTGGGGGSYSATGSIVASASLTAMYSTTWAAGYKDSAKNSTNVVANMARAGGISDMMVVMVNRLTVGSGTINTSCQPTASTACNLVGLIIGQKVGGSTFEFSCSLTSGTITVASISNSNATGNFTGSGTCINGTTFASSAFTVTNGSFNVPLIPNVPSSL